MDIDINQLSYEEQLELLSLLEEKERYEKYNKINFFEPYKFQKEFFDAGSKYKARFLCAANRKFSYRYAA
jgi:hypothetical protein